jgi:hypothetical protein
VFLTKDHVPVLFVESLGYADLSKAPTIELSGKRREFTFAKEKWQEIINQLLCVSDKECVAIVSPRNTINVFTLVVYIVNVRQQ